MPWLGNAKGVRVQQDRKKVVINCFKPKLFKL